MSVCRLSAFAALLLPACVAYHEAPADPAAIAAELRARPGGTFTFAEAVATAFAQNPELQALAARARAAGAVTVPVELQSEYRSESEMLAVMIDPVALLGLGPRGGALGTARAEAEAAVQELAAQRWRVAAAIAETFAVEQALAGLHAPDLPVDAEVFERAGLAAPAMAAQLRAAQARGQAEATELQNARAMNRAELCRLLGLPADAQVAFAAGPLPPAPPRSDAALLARPDLALAAARFRLADAEFRRAVRDQYPSLMIGPEIPLRGDPLQWMAVLKLPIGAHGAAAAAGERREAARAELAAAWLAASAEARQAGLEADTARAQASATEASLEASERALRTALVGANVEIDAFDRIAETAAMAVRDTMEHRVAAVAAARASVRAAVSCGWPGDEAAAEVAP
ncbi:MAG: hypothetical protein FJ265_17570 [Planctomycetes bacterium]|nr:hypothetical protein [Planctomycetota bacterium]